MTTFYICRHGETENNKKRRLSGWIDTPLTEEGINNALSSAAKLSSIKFDKIISSDMGRAFATAYIISRKLDYSAEIQRLRGLREVNYGDLANMSFESYPDLSPIENASYIFADGESLTQMQKRVMGCIDDIVSDNADQDILIVGHDGTINAVRASFTNENIGIADAVHNAHDFVAKFVYEKGQVVSFEPLA